MCVVIADTYVCVDLSESHGRSWDLSTSPVYIHAIWEAYVDNRTKAVELSFGLKSEPVDKQVLRDTLSCFQGHPVV